MVRLKTWDRWYWKRSGRSKTATTQYFDAWSSAMAITAAP